MEAYINLKTSNDGNWLSLDGDIYDYSMKIFWTEDVNPSDFDRVIEALNEGRLKVYLSSNDYDLLRECRNKGNAEDYEKLDKQLERNAMSRIKNYLNKNRTNSNFDPYFYSDVYVAYTIKIPKCAYYNNEGMYIESNPKWSTGGARLIHPDSPTRLPIEAKPHFDLNLYQSISRFRYNMMGIVFSDNTGYDQNLLF